MGERGDDAVGDAGDPPGIGSAPEHVAGMEVQRHGGRGVVGHHGAVDVDGALRRPGGAAGEVQQRHVLWIGGGDHELRGGRLHEFVEVQRAVLCRSARSDQQYVLEIGKRVADRCDLAVVEGGCGHQDPAVTAPDPLVDRVRTEDGEQRADHAGVLQRTQHGDVQLRHPAQQGEHAVALADTKVAEHVGEAIGPFGQVGVGGLRALPSRATHRKATPPAFGPAAWRSTAS